MHLVLGIESSCDETACAVLEDGHKVLASLLFSQVKTHAEFGGVVPEVASRMHLAKLPPLLDETLKLAGIELSDISAVAVTRAPGLIGALLVGLSYAKAVAWQLGVPLVGVNHLEGHMLAARLEDPQPEFPYIGLIVSGGHTAIYRIEKPGSYHILGNTRDDAAGEAFDKVAKLLGLGYPGGILIDRLAQKGNPKAIDFPRSMMHKGGYDFSFSGLKTAVLTHVRHHSPKEPDLPDLCASFQEAVVDVLIEKALRAAADQGLPRLVISGGVAANSRLRALAAERCKAAGVGLFMARPAFCTDNAAMIAYAGWEKLARGQRDGLDMGAKANESLF